MPIQPGEPVYFLALELQNVGAFGPQGVKIDLSDGQGRPAKWTLILGENGAGKTTALECLLALTPTPEGAHLPNDFVTYAHRWTYLTFSHRFSKLYLPSEVKIVLTVSDSFEGGSGAANCDLYLTASYDAGGHHPKEFNTGTTLGDGAGWPGKLIFSYSAARDRDLNLAGEGEQFRQNGVFGTSSTLSTHVSVSIDQWLLGLHHLMLAQEKRRAENNQEPTGRNALSEFEEVKRLLIEALPGVNDIVSKTPENAREAIYIEYQTDDGWFPYANLGLGYKSVMGLIGDLAYRLYTAYPDSPEPLKEAAVVLIDEIDLHLHAKWQRDLIRVLSERFPNVQFIATAHSPLMVQAAAGHNLVLLYRDPETRQVRVANDVDDIANWRLDQIVTSELFGVPSARPPKYDKEIEKRDAILAKPELTEADRMEVRRIEAELGDVPLLASLEGRRTEDLLRQALAALEGQPER